MWNWVRVCMGFWSLTVGASVLPSVAAAETKAAPKHIVIGVDEGARPYVVKSPDGLSGIDVDIIAQAFAKDGLDVHFVGLPAARLPLALDAGQVSAIMTYDFLDDRAACRTTPYRVWLDAVIAQPHFADDPDGLKDARFATFPGAYEILGDEMGPLRANLRDALTLATSTLAATGLYYRRFDAYVGDVVSLYYHYNQIESDGRPMPVVVKRLDPAVQFLVANDTDLCARFDAGFARLYNAEDYAAILQRHALSQETIGEMITALDTSP